MTKITITIIIIFSFLSCSSNKEKEISVVVKTLNVFDGSQTSDIAFSNRIMTVLEATQRVTVVETHPVGKYVFVTGIDNIKGIRGEKAWYYKINGKSVNKLAINKFISQNDTILWIYKKDVCSASVDSCKQK